MMAIDHKQIDAALSMQPTADHCRAIDKVLSERRRIAKKRAAAAVRVRSDSPWVIIRVSGSEVSIRDEMHEAGIEVLVPMKKGKEIRRRGFVIPPKSKPVLVGYILVRCDLSYEAIEGILSFDRVVELLGTYDKPFLMDSDKVIEFNRKAEKGEFDDERPVSLFSHLRKVQIVDGPFAGYTAEVVTPVGAGSGTAVVEIVIFGRPTPMNVSLAFLKPL